MRIIKFFGTSAIATGVDFLLYTGLIHILSPVTANFISALAGLLCNFYLQKRYVFNPTNSLHKAFALSVFFSLCGLGLGTGMIFLMTNFTPLATQPIFAKVITMATIFFYNYFTKKFAFGHKHAGATESF